MSTLHRVAEAAVRRDLHRTTDLLGRPERLATERRCDLVQHLVWMTSITESGDPRVSVYAAEVRRTAGAFGQTGERPEREALVHAINRFAGAVAGIDEWTSVAAICSLDEHLPWLLDGVVGHQGPGLLFRQQGSREAARARAAAYRRDRARRWGSLALAATPVLVRCG